MERMPTYQMKVETRLPEQGAEERAEDIRDEDEAEEEEDLIEVEDRLCVTTVEHQGTTHKSVRIRHSHHVSIVASLITL